MSSLRTVPNIVYLSGLLRDCFLSDSWFKQDYFDLLSYPICFLKYMTYGLTFHLRKWPDFSQVSKSKYMESMNMDISSSSLSLVGHWYHGKVENVPEWINQRTRSSWLWPYSVPVHKSGSCLIRRVLIYTMRIWWFPRLLEKLLYYPQIFVLSLFTLVKTMCSFQQYGTSNQCISLSKSYVCIKFSWGYFSSPLHLGIGRLWKVIGWFNHSTNIY